MPGAFPRGDGGVSTRQMTGAARHDIMSFVVDAWNTWKVLGQGKTPIVAAATLLTDFAAALLAAERVDALRLFELHMAVVEDLSRQHATEVAAWSRLSRTTIKSGGKIHSVYQHESTKGTPSWIVTRI
ncbi:hypothetical protein B0H17DRAFT_957466 [Mycena rosella]|uniref:Uncharacterized protein n=1 Tax=Mycena rosella TaxID=1033263 RepID=A0AAD7CMJ8_MYCRO|nr:hypothetical protein B0H17DRAFT_957466 [Mycena rosella]